MKKTILSLILVLTIQFFYVSCSDSDKDDNKDPVTSIIGTGSRSICNIPQSNICYDMEYEWNINNCTASNGVYSTTGSCPTANKIAGCRWTNPNRTFWYYTGWFNNNMVDIEQSCTSSGGVLTNINP